MIDIESFDLLPTKDQKDAVRSAMLTICNSGVIQIQQEQNMLRILDGSVNEDPVVLANRIIEHRKSHYALADFLVATQQLKDYDYA